VDDCLIILDIWFDVESWRLLMMRIFIYIVFGQVTSYMEDAAEISNNYIIK